MISTDGRILSVVALVLFIGYVASLKNDSNEVFLASASINEEVKILKIKQKDMATQLDWDVMSIKKDLLRLKQDFTDIVSGRNNDNNNIQQDTFSDNNEVNDLNPGNFTRDLSSFEWTHKAIDTIHGDIGIIDKKIRDVKSDLSSIREEKNRTDFFQAEVMEQIKRLKEDAELAKERADLLERNNNRLWKKIKSMKKWRKTFSSKNIEALLLKLLEVHCDSHENKAQVKYRHNRQLLMELHEMKNVFWKLNNENENVGDKIDLLKNNIDSFRTMEHRLNVLENDYNANRKGVDSEIIKLHSSMLELLESVEAQEARIDKMVPEFQNEFNKLDIEVAQMNSHYNYMTSNQNMIRESVKAIAVSVSNVMQKVDDDRALLDKINKSTYNLENQSKLHFNSLKDHISKVEAQQAFNSTIFDDEYVPEILDKIKEMEQEYEGILDHLPKSCDYIREKQGVHEIKPDGGSAVKTFCMNGWTLMQARFDGSVEFNRNFEEYSKGFGDPTGEFWIGNDALYRLTNNNCTMLRIEMLDIYDNIWVANYDNIRVGPASGGYRLSVNGFTGNASDALEYQNNMEFSTIDRDHDISNTNCASNYEGGWWFSHCQHANLNGKYTLGLTWFDSRTNQWMAIKSSRMTLRTNPRCIKQQ